MNCKKETNDAEKKKIWELKSNPELTTQVAENSYQLYTRELTPKILAKRALDYIRII